jgi:hypothetical protein
VNGVWRTVCGCHSPAAEPCNAPRLTVQDPTVS